jgi:SAM-dependent methyltransferase
VNASRDRHPRICLRAWDGALIQPGAAWSAPVGWEDEWLLRHAPGPVLDVGCGPGRHVTTLTTWGVPALGIDITPAAVAVARRLGASVLHRSVFDRVPGAGRWASALLLDGNVGIGGDPVHLLTRVASLVRPGGPIFVELAGPGTPTRPRLVYLDLAGHRGPVFDWSTVGVHELRRVASLAALQILWEWSAGPRWFAVLGGTPRP